MSEGSLCHDGVSMTSFHSFCLLAEPERVGLGSLLGFLGCFNETGVCLTIRQCVFLRGRGLQLNKFLGGKFSGGSGWGRCKGRNVEKPLALGKSCLRGTP